jgi:hypothetical protein
MNPYYSSYPTLQWQEENQQSVALNETAITIRVGESFPLTASTIPDSASVTWSVPAQDNITLSSTSGNAITITALKVGEVPVTARIAYASTVCVVTVIPSFSIEPETLTLYEDGDVGTITATMHVPADEIIGCISNNTTVADVSIAPTGEPGIYEITVTSGTVGSAKIIFTSALGCVVECEVNVVIYPPDAIRFSIVPDSDGYFTSIVDSPVQMTIIIDDAAGRVKNKVVELTSSDPSITTIIQSPTNPLTYRVTFSAVVDHVTLTATHESGVSASLNFEVIGDIWR